MPGFTCPDCGHTAYPESVEKDRVVGAWAVTCADCGTTTLRPTAFGEARVEEHRAEVK